MKTLVNTETNKSVPAFIKEVENQVRQADSRKLVKIMKEITGKQPKLWGERIIGFGKYRYKRKSGDEFEWFNVGFSPGKTHLTVYVMYDINDEKALLKKLGPHKTGKGCLYLKKLDDINVDALKKIISKSDQWQYGS